MAEKKHVSIVICGHVDSGKSTTTGRLIYELGGISERDMEKLRKKADELGKGSFAFAFYMDTQKEEQERGVTINCTTKEFYTDNFHYTIIDAPGHRDFIKNMVTGASQADVALLMVPANKGGFEVAIQKGNAKENEVQGQTRHHGLLLNLLGVEQLIVGINKMDDTSVNYSEERFNEIRTEVRNMLTKVGWKKDFVMNNVPFLPISGWEGDNLLTKSDKMSWWKGQDVKVGSESIHIDTLQDALNNMVRQPERKKDLPLRIPTSGVFNIKGAGDVITGRVEQGCCKKDDQLKFIPTHTNANPCTGKVFKIEMHHQQVDEAGCGDNVGMNIKGLTKGNMPHVGDVMVRKSDDSLVALGKKDTFTALVKVLEHPGQLKTGYTPVGRVRTASCALRLTAINWKLGKSTGGAKLENPDYIESGDNAEIEFSPQAPFVVEPFQVTPSLGRLACFEGNGAVMLGKVTKVTVDGALKYQTSKAKK